MYRLLIADDEPKIRKGLASLLPWSDLGFSEILFAANGKEAVNQTIVNQPDLCLLDICMPQMNGLEFVAAIRREAPDMICIIVSGHDEFEYAKRALQLGVLDYILKPVQEEALQTTVLKALGKLHHLRNARQQQIKAQQFLSRHLPAMREKFLNDLVTGVLAESDINDSLAILQIDQFERYGLVIAKLPILCQGESIIRIEGVDWPMQLLLMAIRNVLAELLSPCGENFSCCDSYRNILTIVSVSNNVQWEETLAQISDRLFEFLKIQIELKGVRLDSLSQVPVVYADWIDRAAADISPVVRAAQRFMENSFANPDLSIQAVSDQMHISVSHLSNLFRIETGMTLIDYLTRIRIQRAARLLEDSGIKIVDIAQQVGYNRQHYFCSVFKRMMGQSPTEFRQSKQSEKR
jgi:two-component system response regulator YesN